MTRSRALALLILAIMPSRSNFMSLWGSCAIFEVLGRSLDSMQRLRLRSWVWCHISPWVVLAEMRSSDGYLE